MSEKPFIYPVDDFQVQVRFSEGATPLPVEVRLVYGFRLDGTRFRTVTYRIPVLEADLFVEEGQNLVNGETSAASAHATGYKIRRAPSGKPILLRPVTGTEGEPPTHKANGSVSQGVSRAVPLSGVTATYAASDDQAAPDENNA